MADTSRGRMGVSELVAGTNTAVYSVTDSMDSLVNIFVANQTSGPTKVNIAIVDGVATDLADEDYIKYQVPLNPGESLEIKDVHMSDDEAVVAYSDRAGVTVRVSGIEEDQAGAGRTQELTASGAVTPGVTSVELNHATVVIAATIADLSAHAGLLVIKDTSASGTAAHTVTLTSGTFNGTNTIATFNAPNEALVIWVDSAGNGTVVENVGSVALSGP